MEKRNGEFMFVDVVAAIFAVTVALNLFWAPFAVAQKVKPKQEAAQKEQARKSRKFL
jgi:hypothetical protein